MWKMCGTEWYEVVRGRDVLERGRMAGGQRDGKDGEDRREGRTAEGEGRGGSAERSTTIYR